MGASTSTHEAILRHAEELRKLATLSYSDFIATVEHLNLVAEHHVDPQGKRLMFAIRSNSADSILWKATVRIDCYKVNCRSCQIETTRILTLHEFIALYNQIILHIDSASVDPEPQPDFGAACEDSACAVPPHSPRPRNTTLDASVLLAKIDALDSDASRVAHSRSKEKEAGAEAIIECCICMERKSSIILPCSHTYCEKCIDSWWESGRDDRHTCPLCRQRLKDKGDQWVLMTDRPDADQVEKEVSSCVVGLAAKVGRPEDPG